MSIGWAMRDLLGGTAILILAGIAAAAYVQWRDMRRDDAAAAELLGAGASPLSPVVPFTPAMLDDLPEPVRRYFLFSIAPGTPIASRVELTMRGTFSLGTKEKRQDFAMAAHEVLALPGGFVWRPRMRSGPLWLTGSDGLVGDEAWTRFWLASLLPVARIGGSPDQRRSAAARLLLEAIWVPASLLPANGASWTARDASHASVSMTVAGEAVTADLEIGDDGRPLSVSTMRWSDANPQRRFAWQPFGGSLTAYGTFAGYTIPTRVEVGNQFGTPAYFPFFRASIETARFQPISRSD
jgi:hypothetical protein